MSYRPEVEAAMAAACCASFRRALQYGTDNEGYGSLVSLDEDTCRFLGGAHEEPLRWCPWCGQRLQDRPGRELKS